MLIPPTTSTEGTIGRDGNIIDVTVVAVVVSPELAVALIPNLIAEHHLIHKMGQP